MGQALYRKYRSKNLSEIVGQDHITQTLGNALKQGKISHAYLFTGPRGTGKTSIARILAHEINQLEYADDSSHLDIIEIDAASNNSVEDIREMREKVFIAPTSAKYKVYIIDEVHMLSKAAFNALLKTLEEPPAHVVFIMATTELHKMPETIISRAQRYSFKLIDKEVIAEHLTKIAKTEGMKVDKDAIELIAEQGRGSFRDSISLLDQVGHSADKVTKSDAERLIGLADDQIIDGLLTATLKKDYVELISSLNKLTVDGVSPSQTARQLSANIRSQIISGQGDDLLIQLLGSLLEVPASSNPAAKLEIVLMSASKNPVQIATPTPVPVPAAEIKSVNTQAQVTKPETPKHTPVEPAPSATETPISQIENNGDNEDWWAQVLTQVKSINNTLYGAMRMAKPSLEGDTLNLGFKFKLHVTKVSETTTQAKIRDAVANVTGNAYKINAFVLSNTPEASPEEDTAADPSHLESVKNIFGGGEVLES